MGAITKRFKNLWVNKVLFAGGADIFTDSEPLIEGHGGSMTMRITNGATGPTVQGQIQPQISHDDTTWFDFGSPLQGGTSADAVTVDTRDIPEAVKYLRFAGGSNTVQSITVHVDITELT